MAPSSYRRCLAREQLVEPVAVEADNDLPVDDGHRGRHDAELRELVERCRVLRDVPVDELHAFLRKILFRASAEQSVRLRVDRYLLCHAVIRPTL